MRLLPCRVDGRLWLYDSGDLCFCWLLNPLETVFQDAAANDDEDTFAPAVLPEAVLVEYLRLDSDIVSG